MFLNLLYVFSGNPEHEYLLKDLGKYTIGKACIYVKKLSDIDLEALTIPQIDYFFKPAFYLRFVRTIF